MISVNSLSSFGIDTDSRVLCVMPHPDDEAIFTGGLLHALTRDHIATRVLTMTVGEKSTLRYGLAPNTDLGKARRKELAAALSRVGVTDFAILTYPDGNLEGNHKAITQTLQKEFKSYRPTHVVTLEPDGIYGHPDHIALSAYVTRIFRKPTRLLYATVSPHYIMTSAVKMAKKKHIAPIKAQFQFRLALSDIIAKLRAMKAHRSQLPFTLTHIPKDYFFFLANGMLTSEFYTYGN